MISKTIRFWMGLLVLLGMVGCATLPSAPGDELLDDVRARLANDPITSRSIISVTLMDGVVSLSGRVPDDTVRHRAKNIARSAEGVKGVVDNLVTP